MAKKNRTREQLVLGLQEMGRMLSTATVLYHQVIAERLGLSASDHKYADVLLRTGPVTAGEFAELTGLTTGAITGVVDRLEQIGLVRRVKDPEDRRRVIIEIVHDPAIERTFSDLFASLAEATERLARHYTLSQLELIYDYMQRCRTMMEEEQKKLRNRPPA
ncbi:MAG TPA: MarR family transcriptional regulator [Candidatus Kapabacteria bacterium]|nr:MarR family transcriptional regulator [Candidatus Kapabacteria bacterium]